VLPPVIPLAKVHAAALPSWWMTGNKTAPVACAYRLRQPQVRRALRARPLDRERLVERRSVAERVGDVVAVILLDRVGVIAGPLGYFPEVPAGGEGAADEGVAQLSKGEGVEQSPRRSVMLTARRP
jgi:hypothetical protein